MKRLFQGIALVFILSRSYCPSPVFARTVQGGVSMLVGTDTGLYNLTSHGNVIPLRTGEGVRKIIRTGSVWAALGEQGILISRDRWNWETRNEGLPVKTVKVYEAGQKSFIPLIQEIKDLEYNPGNPDIMVCATKDMVFLTRNGGLRWESLGAPPYRSNGIKAVAVAELPELTVFLSHSIYGIYYITPGTTGARWTELNEGLEKMETTDNPDEVSDIAVVFPEEVSSPWTVYVSQTFRRRVYRLNWAEKRFLLLWSDPAEGGATDSLSAGKGALRFIRDGAVMEILPQDPSGGGRQRQDIKRLIDDLPRSVGGKPNCLFMDDPDDPMSFSELWLLDGFAWSGGAYAYTASAKEGIYLPVNHTMDEKSLNPYLELLESRGLNMVVVDMKDDWGRLRFTPRNPAITEKGRVFRPLDIDQFLKTMKERGIYTIARIVVFKDPELAGKGGGKYAVWDSQTNRPWTGYYDRRQRKPPPGQAPAANQDPLVQILPADDPGYEIVRTFYDERWVDPYSEEVWEYIAAVSRELHERGFDEIQFDYIRFPTDGVNLNDARYRWREQGMDMESAILSFLRHVRSRINAPISIDIYGANGWYRTGARTGQEVELLAPYVDVICPMYYPSHFEQNFLAQAPAELRPYRIYYQGIKRAALIARNKIVVRPYVQAFFLNVAYDRTYYNADYVRREIAGVRAAGNSGFTYWNNSGRYDDIPPAGSGDP
ncbi:MAG: hypothetical protein LBP71_01680 [Spirochaetaceae bacterium]|jgi:hypothetical protein|nr:hypothetical protein [Spirochaetaceae bacterium]